MSAEVLMVPAERETRSDNTSDRRLVEQCLAGDQEAWCTLLDKYRNLIYSIPIKYGAAPEDAADLFQAVVLELFEELPNLREPGALPAWLIRVAAHQCFRWKRAQQKRAENDVSPLDNDLPESLIVPPALVEEVEREQRVRESIARLPERCREMIRMLFYEQPPRSYQEVAEALGVAPGSVGFIRNRCLRRLQEILEELDV
jgi:RNA polymerase sigma factor (sigma-70 family)